MSDINLRRYRDSDIEPAIALWQSAWQAAMPGIDFAARLPWWRKRWIEELLPVNTVFVAEDREQIVGFVVIDRVTGWLDQIVVDPALWGAGVANRLLAEAKRIAPQGIGLDVNQSNLRAVRFYEKSGFVRSGTGLNPISKAPTYIYRWKP